MTGPPPPEPSPVKGEPRFFSVGCLEGHPDIRCVLHLFVQTQPLASSLVHLFEEVLQILTTQDRTKREGMLQECHFPLMTSDIGHTSQ